MSWIARFVSLGMVLAALMPRPSGAQDTYPSRPVNLVTPYAAGGGSDLVTRVLADELHRQLGQPVTVQNVTGAGGNIGAQKVAQAAPDGYTLLLHHVGLATAPALFKAPGFDPLKSFEPVGMFADIPMLLVANRDVPALTMAELFAWVRAQGDAVTFASSGQGSATHLCAILFQQLAGINVTMVQYRGAAPALADLQAGRIHLLCDGPQAVSQLVRSGAIKAFVLLGEHRLKSLPDLPTTGELGLQAMDVSLWYGLYTPAGTPRAVVDRLVVALQGATGSVETRAKLADLEILVFDKAAATPEALRQRLDSQVALWGRVIREARIPVN